MDQKPKILSKSRIKRGLQCPKSLYYTLFQPELEPKVDAATQGNFDEGNEVGERARLEFKRGVLIENEHWDREGAAEATRKAIESGANVIFEASFLANGIFARVDVLKRKAKNAAWDVIEVKKSSKVKEDHYEDVAIQALVLEAAGIKVKSYNVMHLNSDCVYPKLSNLFHIEDITGEVKEALPSLREQIQSIKKMVAAAKEPKIDIGPHCHSPYECPFSQHCWKKFPSHNVFDLPGVGSVGAWKLIESGKTRIEDLDEKDHGERVQIAIRAQRSGRRWVQKEEIREAIKTWKWPM
ncbi:MAG: Dna2/Cas4 domain-containing protein, partial [Bdellovibrionia bacterium]